MRKGKEICFTIVKHGRKWTQIVIHYDSGRDGKARVQHDKVSMFAEGEKVTVKGELEKEYSKYGTTTELMILSDEEKANAERLAAEEKWWGYFLENYENGWIYEKAITELHKLGCTKYDKRIEKMKQEVSIKKWWDDFLRNYKAGRIYEKAVTMLHELGYHDKDDEIARCRETIEEAKKKKEIEEHQVTDKQFIIKELNGSEKQIKWAEDIRKDMACAIEEYIEILRKKNKIQEAERYKSYLMKLYEVDDAKFFIDSRIKLKKYGATYGGLGRRVDQEAMGTVHELKKYFGIDEAIVIKPTDITESRKEKKDGIFFSNEKDKTGDVFFIRNNKLYFVEVSSHASLDCAPGFTNGNIWEEVETVPEEIRDTKARGAYTRASANKKAYLFYNTHNIADGKCFVAVSKGICFKAPEPIPQGFKAGYDFLVKKYNPVFTYRFTDWNPEDGEVDISISANLKIEDFTLAENDFSEVPGLKEYFWEENYNTVVSCKVAVNADVIMSHIPEFENHTGDSCGYDITDKSMLIFDILCESESRWSYSNKRFGVEFVR